MPRKEKLINTFSIKDLGEAIQILVTMIIRSKEKHMLQLSLEDYIKKVLKRFNIKDAKEVTTSLAKHFKITNLGKNH